MGMKNGFLIMELPYAEWLLLELNPGERAFLGCKFDSEDKGINGLYFPGISLSLNA